MKKIIFLFFTFHFSLFTSLAQPMTHPGLLVSEESLARMKQYVNQKAEPAYASFLALSKDKRASADYKMKGPYEIIARDGTYKNTKGGSENDFCAAFYNALMYQLTGEKGHADKALEIINAYSDKLQGIDGHDAPLCCLQGYFLINAMELMREDASKENQKKWIEMIRRAFIPTIDKFEANSPYANGNWGAIVNKMRMAVAIYSDDREMYDHAKEIFTNWNDNCSLPQYIRETGQCQETGRDQGHAQLGIGAEAEICEMAWNQGDDLWGLLDNRMLKGFEYTAKYNLGYDVPFTTLKECTGLYNDWTVPGAMGRGKFTCVYEMPYAHFVGRKHMEMPYTAMVLGKGGNVRPEVKTGNCDAIGLGSLLYYNGTPVDTLTLVPGASVQEAVHQAYTYKAPEGAPLKEDYEVYLQPRNSKEWTRIDTYKAKVATGEISYAFFDMQGGVFVKVITKGRKYKKARIRPDYRGTIANVVNDSTMQFLLFQPENVSVEFVDSASSPTDFDTQHNLLIFTAKKPLTVAEAKKEAKEQGRKFVYYKPGFYNVDSIACKSNTTYYLEGGSYFNGTFAINDCENVSILGRGIARPENGYEGCHVYRSRNVLIDGLIVNTCPVGESKDITLKNLRAISYPKWGDGLNIFGGCENISYDRAFVRSSDDCHTVYASRKGFKGGVKNVHMYNSTLWADVAHPIMIGLHGQGFKGSKVSGSDTIQGLRYEDIDILGQNEPQVDYQGCMAINCGDNNVVKDVVFDNIRIEQIKNGSLFHVKVCYNDKYGLAPGKSIEDVRFHCIRYYGDVSRSKFQGPSLSIISGYAPDRMVKNLTFEDLRVNGRKIYDTMPEKPKWYHTSDFVPAYVGPYVENLKFSK